MFGVGSTLISFIVLGNYSMGLQFTGTIDFLGEYSQNLDIYRTLIDILQTLPFGSLTMLWVFFTMIAFYATSFDSIALCAACYSYKKLSMGELPHKSMQFMWCILLILLPMALLFSQSSMSNLQSVSIIAAFPIGIVMLLIVISFFKDADIYMKQNIR